VTTVGVVVCGWHLNNVRTYSRLAGEARRCPGLRFELSVACHRRPAEVGPGLRRRLAGLGWALHFFPNEGWDWGAFQQFAHRQLSGSEGSDYYLFRHDDVAVRAFGFVEAFLARIRRGAKVVGNGDPRLHRFRMRKDYPEDVLWAERFGVRIGCDECGFVRGSCFFTTRDVVEQVLARIPIKKGKDMLLANSSLRVFGALTTDLWGIGAFDGLGNRPLSSPYLTEAERGHFVKPLRTRAKEFLYPHVNRTVVKRFLGWQKVPPAAPGDGLKVHLDCGDTCLRGYLNVDPRNPLAEWSADMSAVSFEADSVFEILLLHPRESVGARSGRAELGRLHGYLKPGGRLVLEVARGEGPGSWLHPSSLESLLGAAGFRRVVWERAAHRPARRFARVVAIK